MLALTDTQLKILWDASARLPTTEQKILFLRLVDEQLRLRTCDVRDAVQRGLHAVTADDVGP